MTSADGLFLYTQVRGSKQAENTHTQHLTAVSMEAEVAFLQLKQ